MQRFRVVTPSQTMRSTSTVSPVGRRRSPPTQFNNEKQPIMAAPCAKLFLGDLSYHCTEGEIVQEFTKKGYDADVKISQDIDGKPRGYGFAELQTIELATQAREELQGMNLHGRRIRINYAGRSIQDQTPMNTLSSPINSVYIRFRTDLDIIFDEAYLETFFVSYGSIVDVCIKGICKVNAPTKRYGDRRNGSPSVFSHQEGFGFVHFDDANAAIKAAEMVTGDEHTTLDCQCSNNLCRSLDGLSNQSPRPLHLPLPTTAATGHVHARSPRPISGHVHSFSTTTSNHQPISTIHNQTHDQFRASWLPSDTFPTNPPNSSMVPMAMTPSMPPQAYAPQGHHNLTMVPMPMMMPPNANYHPSTMQPMSYSAPPMHMQGQGGAQGAYFYNNGEYYYHNGFDNGLQPMNMNMTMQPSTMYYNPPTVPVRVPHMHTAVPVYRITYRQCVYPNHNNHDIAAHHQIPVVRNEDIMTVEPSYSA